MYMTLKREREREPKPMVAGMGRFIQSKRGQSPEDYYRGVGAGDHKMQSYAAAAPLVGCTTPTLARTLAVRAAYPELLDHPSITLQRSPPHLQPIRCLCATRSDVFSSPRNPWHISGKLHVPRRGSDFVPRRRRIVNDAAC